jgi:FRG domain
MIQNYVCADFSECRSRIEDDFKIDLGGNLKNKDVLLRGENFPYEKSESSMKRFLTEEDGMTMKPFYYVSPFIDFEDIYAEYHSEEHDLSAEEGAGFLQHYGFPTDLFDLSPSFETARFFATHGRETDPIGIVGAFDWKQMGAHFEITDLSNHPVALRPKNQRAFAGRPGPGIIDLKSATCDLLFTSRWYPFRKSSADLAFAAERVSTAYPSEREIAFFFPQDLDDFIKDHFTYALMTDEQRGLVQDKINSIRGSLG